MRLVIRKNIRYWILLFRR